MSELTVWCDVKDCKYNFEGRCCEWNVHVGHNKCCETYTLADSKKTVNNPNEKEENLPFLPLMLLAAFCSNLKEFNLKEFENQKQTDEEIQRNCPSIEWEQDMGAHVPFCKIYGGMCNMQCLQNKKEEHPYTTQKEDE